jgi:amino acid efflux transporter
VCGPLSATLGAWPRRRAAQLPTTLFLTVYLACTISAVRTLSGAARRAAVPALAAVVLVLLFCGWALLIAAVVAAVAAVLAPYGRKTRHLMPNGSRRVTHCGSRSVSAY